MFTYKSCEDSSYFKNTPFLPQSNSECCIAGDSPLGRNNIMLKGKGNFFPGEKASCYTHWAPLVSMVTLPGKPSKITVEGNLVNQFQGVVGNHVMLNFVSVLPQPIVLPPAIGASHSVNGTTIDGHGANHSGYQSGGTIHWTPCLNCPTVITHTHPILPNCSFGWSGTYVYITMNLQDYQNFDNDMLSNGAQVYITGSAGNNGSYTASVWGNAGGQTWMHLVPAVPTTSAPPTVPITGLCDGSINWDVTPATATYAITGCNSLAVTEPITNCHNQVINTYVQINDVNHYNYWVSNSLAQPLIKITGSTCNDGYYTASQVGTASPDRSRFYLNSGVLCGTCDGNVTWQEAGFTTLSFIIPTGQAAYNTFVSQLAANNNLVYITGSTGNDGTYSVAYIGFWNPSTGAVQVTLSSLTPLWSTICDGDVNWAI